MKVKLFKILLNKHGMPSTLIFPDARYIVDGRVVSTSSMECRHFRLRKIWKSGNWPAVWFKWCKHSRHFSQVKCMCDLARISNYKKIPTIASNKSDSQNEEAKAILNHFFPNHS